MWEHYSSIRNLEGPHSGSPEVKVRALSIAEEEQQKEKLAHTPRVLPWQIDVVSQSLPFLADKPTIKRMLEECKGNIDSAVSRLLEAEDGGSTSSAQESSSVEREADSDDEAYTGPNKKQDRRISRATRSKANDQDPQRIMSKLATHENPSSQESYYSSSGSDDSSQVLDGAEQYQVKNEEEEDDEGTDKHSDTLSPDKLRPPRIRLKGPRPPDDSLTGNKTSTKQPEPRVSARQRKDMKKQAQKAARKERAQKSAGGITGDSKVNAAMSLRSKAMTNTPPIESGFRTLYI